MVLKNSFFVSHTKRIDTHTSFLRLNLFGPIVHTSATVESFVFHQDYQILKESVRPVKRFTNDGFGLIYTKLNTSPLPSKSSPNTTFCGTLALWGLIFIGTSYTSPQFYITSAQGYPAFYHTTQVFRHVERWSVNSIHRQWTYIFYNSYKKII